jgi:hypothetical protein
MFFNKIDVKDGVTNNNWITLKESKAFTILPIDVSKTSNFFCIGSCFAENLKISLEKKIGIKCFPDYEKLSFDKKHQTVDTLNYGRYHMNHYTSKSILQEFQRSWYIENDYPPIKIDDFYIFENEKINSPGSFCYQDPYRRNVFANSESDIRKLSDNISECVKSGLNSANVFIITLGLVEIFRSRITKLSFNQFAGYSGVGYNSKDLEFYKQTALDVENDLVSIIKIIKSISSSNIVIFSVSPIPLQVTFSLNDVFAANMYSKSTLRSAVENVVDPKNGIYYFPSYEIAMNIGSVFFQERDMRHAQQGYVDQIVQTFFSILKE